MAHQRMSIARYLVPIGTFIIGACVALLDMTEPPWSLPVEIALLLLAIGLIFATVFVVVHHTEAVAHRIGEPYGTLLLTLAVTAIEVSLIVSLMLHGENNPTLARESVFSTVMIVTTGIVGVCLFVGGLRHHKQDIRREGTNSFLVVLIALTTLTLILPNYTLTTGPGTFSTLQLGFVSLLSVLLYGAFLFAQAVRHREDFIEDILSVDAEGEDPPAHGRTAILALLVVVGLAGIVLLSEQVAAGIEDGLAALQVQQTDAIVGAFIATLVLMPEATAAIRAALGNELQRSLNIALGSACATIGLTIPAVATASMTTGRDLVLGLPPGDVILLVLAMSVSVVSFGTGRTNVLSGLVHLVVFVAYLLLIVVP